LVKYGKHIVVEKPMAITLDDADTMIQARVKMMFSINNELTNISILKEELIL